MDHVPTVRKQESPTHDSTSAKLAKLGSLPRIIRPERNCIAPLPLLFSELYVTVLTVLERQTHVVTVYSANILN